MLWRPLPSYGDGTFTDVTAGSGFDPQGYIVGGRAIAVVAKDLRRSRRAVGHVIRGDDQIRPAGAVQVDELRDASVRRDLAQSGRVRDVREMAAVTRARVVPEQLRVVAGLAEQDDVEPAVAVVVADRRAVAHVPLHQRAHG